MKTKRNPVCPHCLFETEWYNNELNFLSITCKKEGVPCDPFSQSCFLLKILINTKEVFDAKTGYNILLGEGKRGQTSLFAFFEPSITESILFKYFKGLKEAKS